jgi:hypothetical protein
MASEKPQFVAFRGITLLKVLRGTFVFAIYICVKSFQALKI